MKISMRGMCKNAMREIAQAEEIINALHNDEKLQHVMDHNHYIDWEDAQLGTVKTAISVMHDILLAVLNEKEPIQSTREFLCIDDEKPKYFGDVINIKE